MRKHFIEKQRFKEIEDSVISSEPGQKTLQLLLQSNNKPQPITDKNCRINGWKMTAQKTPVEVNTVNLP